MSRTNARKNAFFLLFQLDFRKKEEAQEAKDIFFEENPDVSAQDKDFILEVVQGTQSKLDEIDAVIAKAAKGWSIDRMSKVDLAILRLAVYEMLFMEDTPKSVAINEAVEMAKKFSSDEAPAFINGILGNIIA